MIVNVVNYSLVYTYRQCQRIKGAAHKNCDVDGTCKRGLSLNDARLCSVPDGAGEEDGVLRDDGEPGPQHVQPHLGDVNPVQHDLPGADLYQPEQPEGQRRLPTPRPTAHSDL